MQHRLSFVCLGNICRSPTAEGLFKHLVQAAGRNADFQIESAGLGGWHRGEPADARARQTARAHGLDLNGRAQQFLARDFDRFDLVLAADQEVLDGLRRLAPDAAARAKIHLLREWDPQAAGDLDVPDPYYGGPDGFEQVFRMLERACQTLLASLP